jgi:hypothetical protein
MFKKESENREKFVDLTSLMENAPPKQAPEHFTSNVMAKLSENQVAPHSFNFRQRIAASDFFGFRKPVTQTECAFYFLLTGFFYLILGLIMMIGLPLPVMMQNNGWISFQPAFGLLLAAELFLLGMIIYKKGNSALHAARIGILLYAALLVFNFGIGTFFIQSGAAVFLVAVLSMAGIVLALLLAFSLQYYSPETYLSEVR